VVERNRRCRRRTLQPAPRVLVWRDPQPPVAFGWEHRYRPWSVEASTDAASPAARAHRSKGMEPQSAAPCHPA